MLEADKQAAQMVQSLADISREIERLNNARVVQLKSTHGRFNLFTTLLDAHDEVRLHTRFLAHLLNPKGNHDCGGLFLDLFLEAVGLSGDLGSSQCITVTNEYYTGGFGNIDIYMEFEAATIVIENKIYAGDQDKQLERYAKYADRGNKPWHVFYLTLCGHVPSSFSLGMLSVDKIRPISYQKNILPWLEQSLQKTYGFVNINQALQQYRMTVDQLLGNTLEASDMNEIKDRLKEIPVIMRNADQIEKALQEIRRDRESKIIFECLKCAGGQQIRNEIWPKPNNESAFKFFSDQWGPRNITDLTVYSHNDGLFSLIAYDNDTGKLKKVIDAENFSGTWVPERNYFWREFLGKTDFEQALSVFNGVVEKLNNC